MLTRAAALTAVGAAASLAVAQPALASQDTSTLDLPTVNMEAVLKAAQIDPRRPDTALTPGSKESVLLVEQALADRGLLAAQYVDGHFGTSTITAYAAYQKSLGYTGLDASGLPGPTSLAKLGADRFTVTNVVSAGTRVSWRGVTVNTRTKAMVLAAEALLGRTLSFTQGSYNTGVGASAGTHDGGGALDINVSGMTSATRVTVTEKLRRVGFAAWVRTPAQGDWGYHIHAIAISDPDLSSGAQHQAGDYYLGLNGLANKGKDDGPAVEKVTWEEYQRG
ncbi:peptidoglycan-binding domain-containing protein [Goodfellowiella coeruleoviolacea]|uniref:peptidoglycan-binding domain-containing protein n=1 Tax=Goodfellowiella coeruleoviolacea TaxID=334858 RepID=UPI0020A3A435|nr:peptidoglycan-binding protein [Goodfellowiella coeruleoviolacea]